MVDEHFGIGIVEYMSAGLIPIVNGSGGPRLDIVVPHYGHATGKRFDLISLGFLASTKDEYVHHLHKVLTMESGQKKEIQNNARKQVFERFSNDSFQRLFLENISSLLQL